MATQIIISPIQEIFMQDAKQLLVEAWALLPYFIAVVVVVSNIPAIIYDRLSGFSPRQIISKMPLDRTQAKIIPQSFSSQSPNVKILPVYTDNLLHQEYLAGERNFENWNLSGADLRNLDLRDINLRGANLSGALLICANIQNANLENADLSRAHICDANLTFANLSGANLEHTNLDGAVFDNPWWE
jgi:hypothetical protein